MKKILSIAASFCIPVSIVFTLSTYASILQNHPNGFNRKLLPGALSAVRGFKLGYKGYYIAGIINDSIQLGNYKASAQLLKIDSELRDTGISELFVPDSIKFPWRATVLCVNNDNLVMLDRLTPSVVTFDEFGKTKRYSRVNKIPWTSGIALGTNMVVVNEYRPVEKHSYLVCHQVGQTNIAEPTVPLVKQVDGFFCSDGTICKSHDDVAYVYRYRNEVVIYDTLLRVMKSFHTIDTNFTAKPEVLTNTQSDRSTLGAPTIPVNHLACLDNKYLYIWSEIKSDNQSSEDFAISCSIDIYNIKYAKYAYSIQLPKIQGEPLRSFMVTGKELYAVYDTWIYKFKMSGLSGLE